MKRRSGVKKRRGIAGVLSVFAVVFASMLYAAGRIRRENPIDALKLETL